VTDPYVLAWGEEADRLGAAARRDGEWYAAMAAGLCRADDRLAIDVGCGGAGMAIALAMTLPAGARIVGIDEDEEVLARAAATVEAAGVPSGRVELRRCDLGTGLSGLRAVVADPVDVIWASAVVHHVGDQQAAIDALAALLAPGGRLGLAEGGIRPRHLPWDLGVGEPGLEVRLGAAEDHWFARMRTRLPGHVAMPYGWPEALRRAGLDHVTTRSTLIEHAAPLGGADRDELLTGLGHRVDRVRSAGLVPDADLAVWERLLDPADAAWLGRRSDLFTLDVRSVHLGTAPDEDPRARATSHVEPS
jgi:SAM-dependent methyltransferase